MSADGESNGLIEGALLENMLETGRDVRNHMLFEVSTEAANRGMQLLSSVLRHVDLLHAV